MKIEFRPILPADYTAVREFLFAAGWQQRVADPEKFTKMIEHTSRTMVAFEGTRVVGFARGVCDEISNGYISMVAVAEDMRRQGIGRELVNRLMGNDSSITWVLRAGHGSEKFWEKVGFKRSGVAMERIRN